jgi:hypothetical protein
MLRKKGVGINQVQLLLDPSLKKIRKKAFNNLLKNNDLIDQNDEDGKLTPKTATLAIAGNLIPAPKATWGNRFSLAASFPSRGQSQLVETVTKNECFLWVFPPVNSHATSAATMDRYFGEQKTPSAEMGMGFSIIQAGWDGPQPLLNRDSRRQIVTRYALFTPIWALKNDSNLAAWRLGNILRSTIRDGAPYTN